MPDDANPNAGAAQRWKMPKWGWVLLVGSVALNLLVIGSIVGMRWAGHNHGWKDRGMRGVLRHVPRDQRDEVRQILRQHREDVKPERQELRKLRRELVDYAKSEVVAPAELERRLVRIDEQRQLLRAKLRPKMIELVSKLDPDVRVRVLRRLLGGRRGRHKQHRD